MVKEYTSVVACPDCRGSLEEINVGSEVMGFLCRRCRLIYPIKDSIPLLLGSKSRNYNLEYGLIKNIELKIQSESHLTGRMQEYIGKTLHLLASHKGTKSWEWEDEEFWTRHYAKEGTATVPQKWTDRIWQREFLVEQLANRTNLKGKTILDVGCGEGQNFRLLLSKYCDETTLYIAVDISLGGLKLNRSRNTHKNSFYILCSADSLPFHSESIDILCYFGVLHHTERKAKTIPRDSELIRSGGHILIHEGVANPSIPLPNQLKSRLSRWLGGDQETSAHGELIERRELFAQLGYVKELEVVSIREGGGLFYFEMMRFFRNALLNSKKLFDFISSLDILLIKMLGPIIPFLRSSAIMLLVKKY